MEIFSSEEKQRLKDIMVDEAVHEKVLGNVEAKSVGDFVYGISDGLVEVLAAVSGLSGAISSPLFVAVGGLIVGVSGTLSMAIGAYLSTKSEKDVKIQERKRLELEKNVDQHSVQLRLVNFFTELGVNLNLAKKVSSSLVNVAEDILYPEVKENPVKSALITGLSYITGANNTHFAIFSWIIWTHWRDNVLCGSRIIYIYSWFYHRDIKWNKPL